jgi:demethylmenaquinone methyltransferase / 2-methoxy-6-polyprenyl-1,4-benzoquinol methylase
MYRQETIKPYSPDGKKGSQVAEMFNNIAHSYDLLNHSLSLGIDRLWRRRAINSLKAHSPRQMLDVATGTGDFAILAARMLKPEKLTGIDISQGMIDEGLKKVEKAGLSGTVSLETADCMHLPFADNSFDAVTVAYGVRNFENLDLGLREMLRVLRPGGRLVIVELTTPERFPMKQLFALYSHTVFPLLGRLISRDDSAYKYLPATMRAFPHGNEMKEILRRAGFSDIAYNDFLLGINTLYTAAK